MFLQVVLCQYASVGVRVVAADDNYRFDTQFVANLDTVVELPCLFQFGTTRADNVETAGVAVVVNHFIGQQGVLAFNQAARTAQETIELVLRVEGFQPVVQAADNIVSAGGLTAGENHTHVERLAAVGALCGLHGNNGQTVGIREERLNLRLVGYGLCFLAFYKAYGAAQRYRHLRLVTLPRNLKWTFLHSHICEMFNKYSRLSEHSDSSDFSESSR